MTSSDVPAPETSAEKPSEPRHKQKSDFFFLSELGCGSFSTVHLVSERSTSRRFACKECLKKQIIRERKVDLIYREKEAMRILSASSGYAKRFFVQIYCTFQDSESLYFVMTLGTGGELRTLIRKEKQLSSEVTARYGAHIVMALDHMHKLGIIHRDLKPENILLNREGDHILLSDFGSVKIVGANESEKERLENKAEEDVAFGRRRRKNSFVGTAQYVSPEVLNNEPVSEATDFWALGCVLFQMLVGRPPFHGESEYLIFQIVLKADFTFPEDFDNTEASDLIKKLLVLEPSKRLGSKEMGGAKSVSSHPFLSKTFDDLETAIAKLGI